MMFGKWSLPLALAAAFATFALAEGETNLDAQIEAIKKAPPQERRELMNRLKMELAKMNREQRMEAIQQLRASMQPHMPRQGAAQHGMHPHPQMVEMDQMKQMGQMGHREEMGQRQGVEQYIQQHRPEHGQPPFGGNSAAGGAPSAGGSTPPATGGSAAQGAPHPSPMPFGRETRR